MHFSDPQQGIHATSLILLSPAPSLTDKRADISCQPVSPLQLYPYFTVASDMSWEGFVAKRAAIIRSMCPAFLQGERARAR